LPASLTVFQTYSIQGSLDLVKAKLAKDKSLQKLITNFENQTKSKLQLDISLAGAINW
jgi:hypothetical protein